MPENGGLPVIARFGGTLWPLEISESVQAGSKKSEPKGSDFGILHPKESLDKIVHSSVMATNSSHGQSVVPENEIALVFVRSSGPGGQNVNKTSTKAQLHWHVGSSKAFSDEQKAAIRKGAGVRLNAKDEIVLASDNERSQLQNRGEVVRRLQVLVAKALMPRRARRPTKVSKSQKRLRLSDKRRVGEKKSARRAPQGDW